MSNTQLEYLIDEFDEAVEANSLSEEKVAEVRAALQNFVDTHDKYKESAKVLRNLLEALFRN